MKNRPKPIEYKFSRKENKVYMYWREVRNSLTIGWNCWSFSGLISEEEIKLRLTVKQFAKFKNGDDGPFISSPVNPKDHNSIQKKRNESKND